MRSEKTLRIKLKLLKFYHKVERYDTNKYYTFSSNNKFVRKEVLPGVTKVKGYLSTHHRDKDVDDDMSLSLTRVLKNLVN